MELRKINDYQVELIEPAKVIAENVFATKTLDELEADYLQALNSVEAQRTAFEAMIAPQQATVDLFLARLEEAKKQGIIAKPIKVKEEIIETPIEPIDEPIMEDLKTGEKIIIK